MNKPLLYVGLAGLLLTLVAGAFFINVEQTSFKEFKGDVQLPVAESYACISKQVISKSYDFKGGIFSSADKQTGYCGQQNLPGYFPEGCSYTFSNTGVSGLKYKVCQIDQECEIKFLDPNTLPGTKVTIHSNEKIEMEGKSGWKYTVDARAYGLDRISPIEGRFFTKDCSLIQKDILYTLDAQGKPVDLDRLDLKPFESTINVINGGITVPDPLNVIYHPKTGEIVYVKEFPSGIKVCPTYVADGKRFYDVNKCTSDSEVFCLPSNPACGDQGNTVVNPGEGKLCGSYKGIIGQYVPVSATEKCLVECASGGTKINEGQCQARITSAAECPSERPFLIGDSCVASSNKEAALATECKNDGGTWVQKETKECGILCNLGIAETTTSTESFCKQPNYLVYIILGFAAIIFTLLITGGAKTKK